GLIDFNTRQNHSTSISNVVCVITGKIISGKTDTVERRKRGKPKNILDESSTTSDESVIDIYLKDDPVGYRVYTSGFDFSCLGTDKGILASENIRRLLTLLAESVPGMKVITVYD